MSRKSANALIEEYVEANEGSFVQVLHGFKHAKWEVTVFPIDGKPSVGKAETFREAVDEAFVHLGGGSSEPAVASAQVAP